VEFLGFELRVSAGRSAQNALDALWVGLMGADKLGASDCDIRGFFDAIDHRVADKVSSIVSGSSGYCA